MDTSKTKLSLIITIVLLIISLAVAIVSVSMTVREVHHFQQQHTLATHKDVRAIQPWMTLGYISRFYHVPEPYLVNALHLTDTHNAEKLPIQILAQHNSRSVTQMTDALQVAIIVYHREHPPTSTTPTATPHRSGSIQARPTGYTTPTTSVTHHLRSTTLTRSTTRTSTAHLHRHTTVRSVTI